MSSQFLLGMFVAVSLIFGWRGVCGWAWRFAYRRRRIPVGYLLTVLRGSLDSGTRISYRQLVNSPKIFGRSYGLILLKQGPNEPTAEKHVAVPFTEPLDDGEAAA